VKKMIAKNELYELEVDIQKNRMYFTPLDVWKSPEDVPDYLTDIKKCANMLKQGFCVLSDITHAVVPSPEVSALLLESQEILKKMGQKKAAIFNKSMILDIHLDNIYEQVDQDQLAMRIFDSTEEAEKWLDE